MIFFYCSFVFFVADRNGEDSWTGDFPWTIVMVIVIVMVMIIDNGDDDEEERNVVQSIINIFPEYDQLA